MNNTATKTFKDAYGDYTGEIYKGDLDISFDDLTSLEGCFKEVQGNFYCAGNHLTSFEFCPEIEGDFNCHTNQITSFKFCPDVQGDFVCNNNQLTSFEHCPDIKGNFHCYGNPKLKIDTDESLEGLLSADIQGEIKTRLDLSVFKEYKKIYKNVQTFKKLKLLKGFIEIGN